MYYIYFYYRLQTKFAKVMFLHLSVSHSGHGGGGSPGPHLGGRFGVSGREVCRPTTGRKLRGLAGGSQAHTQAGLQAHTWGEDVQAQAWGVYPSIH